MKKRTFYHLILLIGFSFIVFSIAQAVSLPDFSNTKDLPDFISSVYSFSITILGIAVFIRILHAGFLMLTAAGNAAKWNDAKSKMTNAIAGAILLVAAYLILYIINPDLVSNAFRFTIPAPPGNEESSQAEISKTSLTAGPVGITGVIPANSSSSLHHLPTAKAQGGIYAFTIKVTDRNGDTCRETYSLEVLPNTATSQKPFSPFERYSAAILNAVSAQEERKEDIINTLQKGGCIINTSAIPDAVENIPYYAEIYVAGEPPFSYEIEDGHLPTGLNITPALEMPVLTIQNLTAKREPSYVFYQTDKFRLEVSGAAPNSKLYFRWYKNGKQWFYPGKLTTPDGWTEYGATDKDGKWVNEAIFTPNDIGVWQEYVMINGAISKVLSFEVISPQTEMVIDENLRRSPLSYVPPGGVAIASCFEVTYCEDPETGERTPVLTANQAAVVNAPPNSCPDSNLRKVSECHYPEPEENPADECQNFERERESCAEQIRQLKNEDGTINTSKLPHSADGIPPDMPSGSLYTADQYAGDTKLGGENKVLLCRYSDQVKAIHCGQPNSGEFCLPNRSAGINMRFCAR